MLKHFWKTHGKILAKDDIFIFFWPPQFTAVTFYIDCNHHEICSWDLFQAVICGGGCPGWRCWLYWSHLFGKWEHGKKWVPNIFMNIVHQNIQFSNSENIVKIFVFVFVLLNATSLLILARLSFIQDRLLSTIFVRTCFKPSTHKLLCAGLILSYQ